MNLEKLFETQKVLRERINYQGEDRFNKLVLALLVELGECANEWRGFKFWSKDQEPRVKVPVTAWGEPYKNPLLEEYVDSLHFVLEIGIELQVEFYANEIDVYKRDNITNQFIDVKRDLFATTNDEVYYLDLLNSFVGLGEMLGFTWEEVEQAYYDKNKVNHQRQEDGY